jgi:hypothetical protein
MQCRVVLALALALSFGCKTSAKLMNDPHKGQFELEFHNEVGGDVCELYIFPEGERNEGNNWLTAEQRVPSGSTVAYWLDPAVYQVHAVGCSYEPLLADGYTPRVAMNTHGVVVLFREDVATSKAEATRLAHDHHNATPIPAKLTANKAPTKRPSPPAEPAARARPL